VCILRVTIEVVHALKNVGIVMNRERYKRKKDVGAKVVTVSNSDDIMVDMSKK